MCCRFLTRSIHVPRANDSRVAFHDFSNPHNVPNTYLAFPTATPSNPITYPTLPNIYVCQAFSACTNDRHTLSRSQPNFFVFNGSPTTKQVPQACPPAYTLKHFGSVSAHIPQQISISGHAPTHLAHRKYANQLILIMHVHVNVVVGMVSCV